MMKGALTSALVAAVVWPAAGARADRSVSVALLVPHEDLPDIVCVTSEMPAPEVLASYSSSASAATSKLCRDERFKKEANRCLEALNAIGTRGGDKDCDKDGNEGDEKGGDKGDDAVDGRVCLIHGAKKLSCAQVIEQATGGATCACPPKAKSSDGTPKLVCAINSQTTERALEKPRLLVLGLNKGPYHEVEPQLTGLTLDGNQLIVRLDHVTGKGREAAAYLEVQGGHFQSGPALVSLRSEERVEMQLTPLVVRRKVVLPPSLGDGSFNYTAVVRPPADAGPRPRAAEAVGAAAGAEGKARAAAGTAVLPLPFDSQKLQVVAPHFTAVAEAIGEAPEIIRPRLRSVKFSWRADCLYDVAKWSCPIVKLPDVSDVPCEEHLVGVDVCAYTCTPPAGVDFDLPVVARFSVDQSLSLVSEAHPPLYLARWQDEVRTAGQMLTSFTAPEERQLVVNPQGWPPDTDVFGERIYNVLLLAHGSEAYRLEYSPGPKVVTVPRLACNDNVVFETYGELRYTRPTVAVGVCGAGSCPGAVALPAPKLDEKVTFGLTGGVGGYRPFGRSDDIKLNWYVLSEFVVRLNVRAAGWGYLAGLWFLPLPRALELRLGGLLSDAWAQGLAVDDPKKEPITTQNLYGRGTLIGHASWKPLGWLGLSGGMGLSYGRAWWNRDLGDTPGQWAWIPGSFVASLNVHRRLTFEVRLMLLYEHMVISKLKDLGAAPVQDPPHRFLSLFAGGAVHFDL